SLGTVPLHAEARSPYLPLRRGQYALLGQVTGVPAPGCRHTSGAHATQRGPVGSGRAARLPTPGRRTGYLLRSPSRSLGFAPLAPRFWERCWRLPSLACTASISPLSPYPYPYPYP